MKLKLPIIFLIYFIKESRVKSEILDVKRDNDIIRTCLDRTNNTKYNTSEFLDMFHSVNYYNQPEEKLPCFSRCIAQMKGWFDITANRWNEQKITPELGFDYTSYDYCRSELEGKFKDVCHFAFKGLKCLKQADVNVPETYWNYLLCLKEKRASRTQIVEYSTLPSNEAIPCLFKCFADKAQLYDKDNNWNLANWIKSFGAIEDETVYNQCYIDEKRRTNVNICAVMYDDYKCWERLNRKNGNECLKKWCPDPFLYRTQTTSE